MILKPETSLFGAENRTHYLIGSEALYSEGNHLVAPRRGSCLVDRELCRSPLGQHLTLDGGILGAEKRFNAQKLVCTTTSTGSKSSWSRREGRPAASLPISCAHPSLLGPDPEALAPQGYVASEASPTQTWPALLCLPPQLSFPSRPLPAPSRGGCLGRHPAARTIPAAPRAATGVAPQVPP